MHIPTLLAALIPATAAYTKLSDSSLKSLPSPGSDFDIKTGALLSPLLTVRVPGTPGIAAVQAHFVTFFQTHLPSWKLSFQNSTQPTALGRPLPFVNIVATRDPPWAKQGDVGRLALVAHYDSKIDPPGFIGATDSAAPCAMILHAARSVDAALTRKWEAMKSAGQTGSLEGEKGVQIILLDGEEAFLNWSDEDSLYGARALAASWEQATNPAMSTFRTPLSEISLFLLLDLLGSRNPSVPSYFKTTHWAYQNMASAETRLRALKLFKSSPNHPSRKKAPAKNSKGGAPAREAREPKFLPEANKKDTATWLGGLIQDDHIPFMAKGVEVLHMIPDPFPTVWHRIDDDGAHLDGATVEDWALLVTAFAAEWLDLEGYLAAKPVMKREVGGEGEAEVVMGGTETDARPEPVEVQGRSELSNF
ncbi:putative glutaminyl cyclase [Trichodelitschia bisporula]|uniref:Peptide hydrolase n=1 Tax=Trichodelitschia bisporula TaxID=703511 RepID=A0A6G1I373_9PEZI|nr:putative glutaminyl cyclase [Trichodelitschia bisporula]